MGVLMIVQSLVLVLKTAQFKSYAAGLTKENVRRKVSTTEMIVFVWKQGQEEKSHEF